jgi:AP-3 complex subunit delta
MQLRWIAFKDLTSAHPTDAAVSLNGLSHIATAELARDLSRDMFAMLNHSRAHIRKRAVVAMFKIFSKYPDAIPTGMPRVREKLEDSDPGMFVSPHNYFH